MSRPSQTESVYVQTLPDGKCLCPDFRAFKIAYVQTIVRSKLHMSRLSCVQNCICPDYRAFKIAYVQTIVRSFSFPDRVILNARRHLVRSFRSGHIDFRSGTSTWVVVLDGKVINALSPVFCLTLLTSKSVNSRSTTVPRN